MAYHGECRLLLAKRAPVTDEDMGMCRGVVMPWYLRKEVVCGLCTRIGGRWATEGDGLCSEDDDDR